MREVSQAAANIVGVLADADRRRMLAAVELGARTLDEATAASGLPANRAAKAIGKLLEAGVVTADAVAGGYAVDDELFASAAREALARRRDEHDAEPPDVKRVLDAFVRDGRITSIATARAKRRILFDWLARRFEIGRRYTEAEVTAMLDGHSEDPVSLRRSLVDLELLDRAEGLYWRCGGTVDVAE